MPRSKHLTFDEVLEGLNDGFSMHKRPILASALRREVWVAEWHIPGCLSESRSICLTKADAIEAALSMAETECGPPRGMKSALQHYGRFDCRTKLYGMVVNTVEQHTLADLL